MFEDRFQSAGPKLRLVKRSVKQKPRRILRSALKGEEQPQHGVALKMLERYFEGPSPEERRKVEYSALTALAIFALSLYIIWPTVMESLNIAKEEEVYDIAPSGMKSSRAPRQSAPKTVTLKTKKVPALYPKVDNVVLEIESPIDQNIRDHYSDLAVDGSVSGLDLGVGDGIDGPVLFAGEGGDVPEPELLYKVEPEYPEQARRERVDGFVLLEAIVNKVGDVVDIKVLQSPPRRYGFAEKAEEAVSQWKFRPSIYRGNPVNVRIRFAVEFNLLY